MVIFGMAAIGPQGDDDYQVGQMRTIGSRKSKQIDAVTAWYRGDSS
jgi:hypothetical protein